MDLPEPLAPTSPARPGGDQQVEPVERDGAVGPGQADAGEGEDGVDRGRHGDSSGLPDEGAGRAVTGSLHGRRELGRTTRQTHAIYASPRGVV